MLMSREYLPNSPYTKQFGVVTLTPTILFKNLVMVFELILVYKKTGAGGS
jgi:hypothetical protein